MFFDRHHLDITTYKKVLIPLPPHPHPFDFFWMKHYFYPSNDWYLAIVGTLLIRGVWHLKIAYHL